MLRSWTSSRIKSKILQLDTEQASLISCQITVVVRRPTERKKCGSSKVERVSKRLTTWGQKIDSG
jgi:hypothetical protein